MNASSSNANSNPEIVPPEVLKDFEYLLSETKKEVIFCDNYLEADYRVLDIAIDERYTNRETYYFRQHIIRSSNQLWKLHRRVEELEKILETKTIAKESQLYPFLDINIGNIDSLLS